MKEMQTSRMHYISCFNHQIFTEALPRAEPMRAGHWALVCITVRVPFKVKKSNLGKVIKKL